MKLAILPKNIPIGATQDIISVHLKKLIFSLLENIKVVTITPNNPPWKDIPPCQSLKTSEKPGWKLPTDAEGNINGNYWSVNENDPYWQTTEGYKEAIDLYGFKPGWVKEPVKKSNIVNLQPTRRISL